MWRTMGLNLIQFLETSDETTRERQNHIARSNISDLLEPWARSLDLDILDPPLWKSNIDAYLTTWPKQWNISETEGCTSWLVPALPPLPALLLHCYCLPHFTPKGNKQRPSAPLPHSSCCSHAVTSSRSAVPMCPLCVDLWFPDLPLHTELRTTGQGSNSNQNNGLAAGLVQTVQNIKCTSVSESRFGKSKRQTKKP